MTYQRGRSQRPAVPPTDPARGAALDVLKAVRVDQAYANLALPAALDRAGLIGRDAAFVTELVAGTLRLQGTYDAVIGHVARRPIKQIEARVLDALRIGAHQLFSMRVPAHAAINTTVDLVRARTSHGAAMFANAVLRRLSERPLEDWIEEVLAGATDPVRCLSVTYSHPSWVVVELRKALGARADELPALLAADNERPGVVLAARPGLSEPDELPGTATAYSPWGRLLEGGDPGAIAAVREGRAGVQDEGSQLVALGLAYAALDGPDATWLDLCAGPGGKAALLAGLAGHGGRDARLLAVERQHHRAGLVRQALATSSRVLGVLTADGTAPPVRAGAVDRVLVDAPCTGLGALRRRPESRWRRRPDDLVTLVLLQRRLLTQALATVRTGGLVLYATCSPVLGETAEVVAGVLARGGAETVDLAQVLPQVPDAAGPLPGTLQLWPHRHGTDAMFLALLRKVA